MSLFSAKNPHTKKRPVSLLKVSRIRRIRSLRQRIIPAAVSINLKLHLFMLLYQSLKKYTVRITRAQGINTANK